MHCSVEIASYGHASNLTLQDTLVGGWWFDIFYGSSNVTVSDSKLYGLGADQFALFPSMAQQLARSCEYMALPNCISMKRRLKN